MTMTALLRMRTPVIIDTDPGVDDIVAILLALASPELDILAFIVSFGELFCEYLIVHGSEFWLRLGNTNIDASYLNILKLYQAIGRHIEKYPEDAKRFPNFAPEKRTKLARGCGGPIGGEIHSAQYFHGRDGLGGITERHPDLDVDLESETHPVHPQLDISSDHGVDIALDLLRSYPSRSITYIVLGPMTNLARVMQKGGEMVRQKIGRIVCMGGALDVPGNVTPTAEFNYFADPFAVKQLLLSSNENLQLPLDRFLLLPLDITTLHELPFNVYQQKVDTAFQSASEAPSDGSDKSPLVHFTSSFLERTREVMVSYGKDAMELHDIVAVWCAIENPPIQEGGEIGTLSPGWKGFDRIFDIERNGELTRGMLVVDRRNDQTAYAPGTNRADLQKQLDSLGLSHKVWESVAVPAQVEHDNHISTIIGTGICCVNNTPGPEILLKLLLRRVWGL